MVLSIGGIPIEASGRAPVSPEGSVLSLGARAARDGYK